MRVYHLQVFDDIISGTGGVWYSTSDYDLTLGTADWIVLAAVPSSVSGTSPTLTIQVEHSGDGLTWTSSFGGVISAAALSNHTLRFGEVGAPPPGNNRVLLSRVRLKITLGGTSPQCRLKVYVTGRARGRVATGAAA